MVLPASLYRGALRVGPTPRSPAGGAQMTPARADARALPTSIAACQVHLVVGRRSHSLHLISVECKTMCAMPASIVPGLLYPCGPVFIDLVDLKYVPDHRDKLVPFAWRQTCLE